MSNRGGDALWKVAVLAGVLAAAWAVTRRAADSRRASAPPLGMSSPPAGMRAHGPTEYDAAQTALREFAREYAGSFAFRGNGRAAVDALHARRAEVLTRLHELRMRLPNDLDAETALARHTEGVDGLLRGYVEDAQRRSGATLVFPGPLDDWFYRRFYRASNDIIE